MNIREKRQVISQKCKNVQICAVTKNRSIQEVESLLNDLPEITQIAENRWPNCEEKFQKFAHLKRHFIGPLQSNKLNKILPLTDVIQSVEDLDLLQKVDQKAQNLNKTIEFCFQVNISKDPAKHGLDAQNLRPTLENYLKLDLKNVKLIGLMTIGERTELTEREKYFQDFKKLFDTINVEYFSKNPLPILSMGMSEDYELAIKAGSTMVRLGTCLFE